MMHCGIYFAIFGISLLSTYGHADDPLQYCADIVFMVQTSCTLTPTSLQIASMFMAKTAELVTDKYGSTRLAVVKYSKDVSEILPLLAAEDFLDQLNTSKLYGEDDCEENMAQTYDALDFIRNGGYFNQPFEMKTLKERPESRGKIVIVLNDGVAFQRKGNMEQAFEKTKSSITALHQEIGVSYMTLEFFIRQSGDERFGSEEMALYQPNLAMMSMDENPFDKFKSALLRYTCTHEDEVITTTTTKPKPTTTTTTPKPTTTTTTTPKPTTTTTTTTATATPTTTQRPIEPEVCVDVVFGIDISCSLEVSNITKAFEISQQIMDSFGSTSQFGGLNYDETVVDTFLFTRNVESAKQSVGNFRTKAVACGTKTIAAIAKARSDYFDSQSDDPDHKNLIILFGDGNETPWKTNPKMLAAAEGFKQAGGTIIWVVLTSNRGNFKIQRGLEEEIKISASKYDNGEPLVFDHLDTEIVAKIKDYARSQFACTSV
ncbi:unnamed protein product [Owenia fusiformis]|uniref:Uncharacterized protein n=1 Tax=Owenia fusiformis TaxID=6347 RepID=A0A8J1XPR2_OWEFU|nr:unnamed protein product [Owenia fusiformis]